MSADLPLIHAALDAPIVFHGGRAVSARELIATADALAARLPPVSHIVNLCENRYHFALLWTAACRRAQVTLLPPSQASGVLADLAMAYPNQHAFDDESLADLLRDLRRGNVDALLDDLPDGWRIPAERVVALTFTKCWAAEARTWSPPYPLSMSTVWRYRSLRRSWPDALFMTASRFFLRMCVPHSAPCRRLARS
jgi:hypothetical protein